MFIKLSIREGHLQDKGNEIRQLVSCDGQIKQSAPAAGHTFSPSTPGPHPLICYNVEQPCDRIKLKPWGPGVSSQQTKPIVLRPSLCCRAMAKDRNLVKIPGDTPLQLPKATGRPRRFVPSAHRNRQDRSCFAKNSAFGTKAAGLLHGKCHITRHQCGQERRSKIGLPKATSAK